jgi:hypothetical protein
MIVTDTGTRIGIPPTSAGHECFPSFEAHVSSPAS